MQNVWPTPNWRACTHLESFSSDWEEKPQGFYKKTASETFSCVCRASLSGNAGKVTWGCWEIRFQSHLQLSANSLIRNTICAIKAGVYSWFLCSSLDFSHALRKAETLLKSMLHTAAWEAFPAVRSFCWCWFIWPAQEFLSSEFIFF